MADYQSWMEVAAHWKYKIKTYTHSVLNLCHYSRWFYSSGGPFRKKNWVGAWLTRAPCAPRPDGAGSRSDAPARDGSESVFPRGSPGSARRLVLIRCPPSRASAQTWIGSVSSRHRPRLPPRPRSHESESFTFPLQISSRFSLWPVLIKSRSRKWFYLQFVPDQTPTCFKLSDFQYTCFRLTDSH